MEERVIVVVVVVAVAVVVSVCVLIVWPVAVFVYEDDETLAAQGRPQSAPEGAFE